MIIGFHSNQLSVRGTEVALFDYANYNESLLQNTSYIFYPRQADTSSLDKFKKRFGERVLSYGSMRELEQACCAKKVDAMYWIKSGTRDGKLISGVKNLVHAVFNTKQPHGEVYAYVSEWLAKENNMDYVPHIVTLPQTSRDLREVLGIPKDALVIGRHGGAETFDIEYVKRVTRDIAQTDNNIFFLFLNTNKFAPDSEHGGKIIHLDSSADIEYKAAFINTCDVMLHARGAGESFGLSVCEFLHQDKPVITNLHCRDRHHINLLGDHGFYYRDESELRSIILSFKKTDFKYSDLVKQFSPATVMDRFYDVFIR